MTRTQFNVVLAAFIIAALVQTAFAQSIRLNWSEDGSQCWFRSNDGDGAGTFFVVDIAARSRTPAFEHAKVANGLSKLLGEKFTSTRLPFNRIGFTSSKDRLQLMGPKKSWILELKTYDVAETERAHDEESRRRLFLPRRKSLVSDESTHITIENQLDHSLGLFWVGIDGTVHSYGEIQSGATHNQHTFAGHVWLLKSSDGTPLACFQARSDDLIVLDENAISHVRIEEKRLGRPRQGQRNQPSRSTQSPDGTWTAFVLNDNLWIRNGDTERQLSIDGTEENSYGRRTPNVRWSADSQFVVAFQTKAVVDSTVYLIESSPDDQLQPKLQSYNYRKPGDELPTKTLHLFSLSTQEEIPVANSLFDNPWSLRFHGWSDSGDRFYLYYNQRGHQVLRLLDVQVANGKVRTVIDETSKTFIQYSNAGKSVFEDLGNDEILWASERTGWNHLYRYSRTQGIVLNPVTSGDWNVKRIENIDHDTKQIWFFAVGLHPGQDPYHEHFCRVNFDGSNFQILTSGDGTHRVRFAQDRKYFIDTYSRVDMAPVTELRESATGGLICKLHQEETDKHFQERRLTERFVAKGRDGKTDIWGIIHWPLNFEPDRKYPVVENIYAGPHDHHVPKSFRGSFKHQHRIADAGMIVVQIDGMGTAWRSKAFHDVCYKNLRDAGFPDRIEWMKAAAKKHPQIDLSRVGIYGGSAGGQNAMAALLWHSDFYKVAVADCGCHDNRMDKMWWNEQWMGWPVGDSYKENSNMENAHLLEGNLMLLVGELDRNVDPASTTQVVRQLIKQDKDFDFVLVAGAGHGSAETPWASRKRLNFLKLHLSVK